MPDSPRLPRPLSRFALIVLVLGLAILACSSSSGGEIDPAEAEKVLQMVEYNLDTAESEHLDGYMWSIHEDAPARSQTEDAMRLAMNGFDLTYEIVDWEVLSISGDTARVRVVQITRTKRPNTAFRDNKLEAVHTLKMSEDGNWKIYSSDMGDVEYLE